MNIRAQHKPDNRLILNGVNLGEYTKDQIKELVSRMDYIAHHKHNLYEKYKDHFKITIRDIDLGVWEVSQIRELIDQLDK